LRRGSKPVAITNQLTLRKIVILNGTEWSEESLGLHLVQFGDISPDNLLTAGKSGSIW